MSILNLTDFFSILEHINIEVRMLIECESPPERNPMRTSPMPALVTAGFCMCSSKPAMLWKSHLCLVTEWMSTCNNCTVTVD